MSKKVKAQKDPILRQKPREIPRKSQKKATDLERPNQDLTIGWNFGRMDRSGKFKCTLASLEEYTQQLIRLENIKIKDLLAKQHNHPINAQKLSDEARTRLPESVS